jgi:hypothetical protein
MDRDVFKGKAAGSELGKGLGSGLRYGQRTAAEKGLLL